MRILLLANNGLAQRCAGRTDYLVRDEAGQIITGDNLKRLTVKNINGIPLKLSAAASEDGSYYYEAETVRGYYQDNVPKAFRRERNRVLVQSNPLGFGNHSPTMCGEIGDVTLDYRGREMRLIFDIGLGISNFLIDSLPFQEGTFYRRSLECSAQPSLSLPPDHIKPHCFVSSDTWKRADKDWVRPVTWKELWVSGSRDGVTCQDWKTEVIADDQKWATTWESHGRPGGNPLPAIDFKTEVVLILYMPTRALPFGSHSAWVNMQGDLKFQPLSPPNNFTSAGCGVTLRRIYRSGIKTVQGKPLPPPI